MNKLELSLKFLLVINFVMEEGDSVTTYVPDKNGFIQKKSGLVVDLKLATVRFSIVAGGLTLKEEYHFLKIPRIIGLGEAVIFLGGPVFHICQ